MIVKYVNRKVEKCFNDYSRMQRVIPLDWVRTIKKHIDRLEAAECFGDFLKLRLGKPEMLSGPGGIRYSLHVVANVRLILLLEADKESVNECRELEVEGVCDYHGGKENWYIP